MHRSSFLCVFAVVALTAGCGDDESDSEDPTATGPIKLSFLLSDATAAQCDYLVRCTWVPSTDLCSQVVAKDKDLIQLVSDTENDVVGYDPAAARVWVDAVIAQPCNGTFAAQKELSDAFDAVFIGRAKTGEACLINGQCENDLRCNLSMCAPDAACCAGACEEVTEISIGDTCDNTVPCADQGLCRQDEMTGIFSCEPRGTSGAMCPAYGTCADGLACDLDNTGTCYKLAAPGEPCNPLLQGPCLDYTTWCSVEEEKCVPLPELGEPCGTNSQRCPLYATCADGVTCSLREYVGAPCDSDGACMLDLYCQDGQCFPAIQPVACGPVGQ